MSAGNKLTESIGGSYQVCDRSLALNLWEGSVLAFER